MNWISVLYGLRSDLTVLRANCFWIFSGICDVIKFSPLMETSMFHTLDCATAFTMQHEIGKEGIRVNRSLQIHLPYVINCWHKKILWADFTVDKGKPGRTYYQEALTKAFI